MYKSITQIFSILYRKKEISTNFIHTWSRAVQYSLDRIYTSRISLNMLTDQHLMVYGHLSTALDQASVLSTFCALVRVAGPHHFNADPDKAFYFYAYLDPDPAPHQVPGMMNRRPPVLRPHRESLWASRSPFTALSWASNAPELLLFYFKKTADPDPQPWLQ